MPLAQLWADLGRDIREMLADFRGRLAALAVSEKSDRTLLTEADVAVQSMIMNRIQRFEPSAHIVAEESGSDQWRSGSAPIPERIWVIDPIDGTAQFVREDAVEYCSVVCLLENREPTHALVVAPELGTGRTPLVMTASVTEGAITVNGAPARANSVETARRSASVTRSAGTEPRLFEQVMVDSGYSLKLGTTSQTLDMVRTALDLTELVDEPARFDLFFRSKQKIWDGLAGLCFGRAVGMVSTDLAGSPRVPVGLDILAQSEPTFSSTVMGFPEAVRWFVEIAQAYPAEVPKSS